MRYRLVVLTHGHHGPVLARTLDAFARMVQPRPASTVIVYDGDWRGMSRTLEETAPVMTEIAASWSYVNTRTGGFGFCGATRLAWDHAVRPSHDPLDVDHDYVFWLEHDFEIIRPVDLGPLARQLDHDPSLAQMALMRDAVNEVERAAGGLFESRPGQYELRWSQDPEDQVGTIWTDPLAPDGAPKALYRTDVWHAHRSYFTTNPSLMRRSFMEREPWPDYESECEGRFGIDLARKGYRYGVWGDGSPWCRHIGIRDGHSY